MRDGGSPPELDPIRTAPLVSVRSDGGLGSVDMDQITLQFSDRTLEDTFIADRLRDMHVCSPGINLTMGLFGALLGTWFMCGFHEVAALVLALLSGVYGLFWVNSKLALFGVNSNLERKRAYQMTCRLSEISIIVVGAVHIIWFSVNAKVQPPLPMSLPTFKVEVLIDAACTMIGCLLVHIAHMPPRNKLLMCTTPAFVHIYKPSWNIGDSTEINLWLGATFMGSSIGYILEHSLRSLFLTQARESRHAAANRAADSRLNHVIKGLCGSASGLISTALLDKTQAHSLSEHAILQLNEAVDWCHQRQLFIQLEMGSYTSLKVDCAVGKLLERVIEPVDGRLEGAVSLKAHVDEGVLRLVAAEAISNATKYRRPGTTIVVKLSLHDGKLRISFENINATGVRRLTEQECAEVFLPGFRVHSVSATSDGVGLDTVHKALDAAELPLRSTAGGTA